MNDFNHSVPLCGTFEHVVSKAIFLASLRPVTWLTEDCAVEENPHERARKHVQTLHEWQQEIGSCLLFSLKVWRSELKERGIADMGILFDALAMQLRARMNEWHEAENFAIGMNVLP